MFLTPGEHRFMIKLFEGGGGNGFDFRLRDIATGVNLDAIGLDDLGITLSLTPTMTQVPAGPMARAFKASKRPS